MKTRILRNRRGTTLIETLISVSLLSLILMGTIGILVTMLAIWAKGSSGTTANQTACLALNRMVREIEEGKSASVQSGKLVVVFPYYDTSTGDYNRGANGDTVTYYLSGDTGSETTGSSLWKSVSGGSKTRLARHIDRLVFNADNPRVVKITEMRGVDQEGGSFQPKTVRTTVRLRNG